MNRAFDPIVNETLHAHETMLANEDALDEKVAAYIWAADKNNGPKLSRISRCGGWYLEDISGKLMQCCIVRLYRRGRSGHNKTTLKEYGIRWGDPKAVVIELLA